MDLIQAYRLEMGTTLKTAHGESLYEFWGDTITKAINKDLKAIQSHTLINLASNEYFNSINEAGLNAEVITPVFKDFKNGQYKILSFFAKKARGAMSAHIINKQITDPEQLKKARLDGYRYSAKDSDDKRWVFLRKQS